MLFAFDIGTTNVKAVVVSDRGEVLAHAERQNTTLARQPGWQEQNPVHLLQNLLDVLVEAWETVRGKERLHGMVFSSAMHGLIALDNDGNPLTNILLWSDARAGKMAQALRNTPEGMNLYEQTGVPIHAMSPLCKIVWLRENMPALFARTRRFSDLKSWLWNALTGEFTSDLSVASASGLLNIHQKNWDEQALSFAGILPDALPLLAPPSHQRTLLPDLAARIGVPPDTPLFIGASDGALANMGSDATQPGQVAITIGTSAAIRTVMPQAVLDKQMRTFCYCIDENRYIVGGASNNGANVIEWLRNAVFQSHLPASDFIDQAGQTPPGSDQLLLLPYLLGERAPLYLSNIRGGFFNLSARHTQAHMVRAALEGVLFNVKMIAEALETHGPIDTLHAGGGFSRSALWVQILADIFQKPVIISDERIDASLLGALHLAAEVLQLNIPLHTNNARRIEPDKSCAGIYTSAYALFKMQVEKEVTTIT
ncbi:MAG: gluconokinase [Bacteroidetes bacterium]|nr:gluconokinase [Bacteroidota bacterium]